MDGVVEMANVDYPHSHTNEGDDLENRQSERSFVLYTNLDSFKTVSGLQNE